MPGRFELSLQGIKTVEDVGRERLLTQFIPHRFDWITLRSIGR
jgi:hypothetical protein